jgi:superoxide reductase
MTALRELYKCNVCGNVVEVVHEGAPALVCCGEDMEKLEAQTVDKGKEKHVPVVLDSECGILVKVGDVEHPMEDKHYIKFIEVLTADRVYRKELNPGDKPEASFCVEKQDVVSVREYCNIHGLWEK